MWKAWGCSRPVLQTVRRAGSQHQRVLARRAAPPCARAVVTTARDLIVRQQRSLADTTKQRWQIARAASSPHLAQKVEPSTRQKYAVVDGNEAAAYVAYAMSDISFIYPISPATSMGEHMDKWAATGKKNIQGQIVDVNMMQSEGGAAGALHGAAAAGALTSTFTASQGLLLMIPNMYLLAGELVPTVLHVSARTISKHALSIFNDHSDVMATRQTGFAMMCSTSVQEVLDLGFASHVASIKARIPFLHFFDGYRTSAEMSKVKVVPYEDMAQMFPADKVQENLHNFALNPTHPSIRGTGQRPDIFFQSTVAANPYYQAAPDIVTETLEQLAVLTGRPYKLFEYYGHPEADRVAICMGSASKTLQETIDHMNNNGEKVGSMTVHLYRPWSAKHFLDALPPTVKKIAVLDRTREDGAVGMPLFLDVNVTMSDNSRPALITGAQYGLASKEFTPAMAKAVLDNLKADKPRMRYVIGIDDDVTHTSLPYGEPINTTPPGTTQCLFWGLGSDGTVGASKTAIKTIGMNTDLKAQGHFVFDSHKGGGVTVSHVRFGPSDIKSEYMIQSGADYLSCSHPSYVHKFDMVSPLKEGGTFVLNAPWSTLEELENNIPAHVRVEIAKKHLQFYTIHATKLAADTGLGKRINSIMQASFYGLSGVLPVDQALKLLKDSVAQQYKHKGPEIVAMNQKAIDHALDNLHKIEYPASWASLSAVSSEINQMEKPEFVTNVMDPVLALKGDDLPVSAFEPGGYEPIGTSMYEKRGIAPTVPVWKPDACTQCNYCAIVCPHAVIRPFLLEKTETKAAPPGFEYRKAKGGSEVAGFNYSIQVSPYDCTGCEVCVETCPDDALYMAPFNEVADKFSPHWDYAIGLPERQEVGDKYSVKGSQFLKPLMEFSGACAGCGETPYLKLATQLFGDRMVIANASGCSSVWGGTATTIPFTTNDEGHGPAWGRSLFEDNAEYGFGMALGTKQRRQVLSNEVQAALEKEDMPEELRTALTNWQKYRENPDKCNQYSAEVNGILENLGGAGLSPKLRFLYNNRDMLRTQSHWMVGGDGWAYDIGYGGLDHILSRNENVNVLVLDTEMYSNTGGQVSKATQLSTVTKFASMGKRENKKDLGLFAMQYGNVFVASVALGANMNQCVTSFKEAEHYPGTSLIIAYSPCIDWGIDMKKMVDEQREAVDTGYWTLYRYDPRRISSGLNPFQLDSKKIKGDLQEYLSGQNRFEQLKRNFSETAGELHDYLYNTVQNRHKRLQKLAMDDYELLEHLKKLLGEASSSKSVTVLYGSETGNAETLANVFATEFKRRGVRAKCVAMDDFDLDELPNQDQVFCVVSTCGQGEMPSNCRLFWKALSDKSLPSDFLKNTKFAVFGLGDSSYVYFNEAAKLFHNRFGELSAESVLDLGLGDDKDEDRYESKWNEWMPDLFNELKTDPPAQVLLPPTYNVTIDKDASSAAVPDTVIPPGSKLVPLIKNRLLTPEDYDRDIRHYEFDLAGSGMKYNVGDCLGIYAHNDREHVLGFCDQLGVGAKSLIRLEDTQDRKEPLPSTISASQLFTEVLDVFGKPSRRFYETLAIAADNESDREELLWMLTKDGNSKLRELTNETVTYANLLTRYPTKKLSFDYLLDHIPRIKPRLYSIASASEMHGDILHLCIVKNDWTTPSGKYHVGLCTNYLQALSRDGAPVDLVASRVNGAGITVPDTNAFPCVMVGLGTGIAPLRAMVQDREVSRTRGETVGPMALFFGARYRRTDFTYGDEFEEYHSDGKGVLSVLSTAFSRDQAHKIYVQNRISEYPEVIYDYLGRKNGYFYLCGPAGNVPTAVRQAVVDAFVSAGGHSPAEAEKIVTQMQIEGRYNVEAW